MFQLNRSGILLLLLVAVAGCSRQSAPDAAANADSQDHDAQLTQETAITGAAEESPSSVPQPVSWLERLRYWDMAQRVIAERHELPVDFSDAAAQEFATAMNQVHLFCKHMYKLQESLQQRQQFALSDYFDEEILAALRGEISLPNGTRSRRKRLQTFDNLSMVEQDNGLLDGVRRKLVEDNLTKGDILELALHLREYCMDFKELRKCEIALDEYLMSFPLTVGADYQRYECQGWYKGVDSMAPRELWAGSPPRWFTQQFSMIDEAFNTRSGPPQVLSSGDFRKLWALADRLEEMSGGKSDLLIFPDVGLLPERKRIVDAWKLNLEAYERADTLALQDFRIVAYDRIGVDPANRLEQSRLLGSGTLFLSNVINGNETSDRSVAQAIDQGLKMELGAALFYEWDMPEWANEQFSELALKRRRDVFDTGAKFYFAESE